MGDVVKPEFINSLFEDKEEEAKKLLNVSPVAQDKTQVKLPEVKIETKSKTRAEELGIPTDLFGDPIIQPTVNSPGPGFVRQIPEEKEFGEPLVGGFSKTAELINGGYYAIRKALKDAQGNAPLLGKFLNPFKSPEEAISTGEELGEKIGERAEATGRAALGLIEGIVDPVITGAKAATQQVASLFGKEDLYGYTPDEILDAYKGAGINYILMASGEGLFKGLTRPLALGEDFSKLGVTDLTGKNPAELADIFSKELPKYGMIRTKAAGIAQGSIEGAVFGATTSKDEDKLNTALTMGIIGGTLGAVFSNFKSVKGEYKNLSESAGELLRVRNFNEVNNTLSFDALINRAEALKASPENLIQALAEEYTRTRKNSIVRGARADVLDKLPSYFIGVDYKRSDGLYDIMIGAVENRDVFNSFRKTGLFPGQIIEHNGKKAEFIGQGTGNYADDVNIQYQNSNKSINVPRDEIRDLSGVTTIDHIWSNVGNLTLKGQFIKEIKDMNSSSRYNANMAEYEEVNLGSTSLSKQSKNMFDDLMKRAQGVQQKSSGVSGRTLNDVELIGIRYDRGSTQKVKFHTGMSNDEIINQLAKEPSLISYAVQKEVISSNDIIDILQKKKPIPQGLKDIVYNSSFEDVEKGKKTVNVKVSDNPHIPGTPKTYAADPRHVQGYSDPEYGQKGVRGLFGDPGKLQVKGLKFKKAFVYNGKHYEVNQEFAKYFDDLEPDERSALKKARLLTYEKAGLKIENPDIKGQLHSETGYQFWDQAITRILRKRGYDGLVMEDGFGGTEIMDLTGGSIGEKIGAKKLETIETQREITHKTLYDYYVNSIKNTTALSKYSSKDLTYNFIINKLSNDLGLETPEQITSLRVNVEQALREHVGKLLKEIETNGDQGFDNLAREAKPLQKLIDEASATRQTSMEKLAEYASTNSMYLENDGSGNVTLRDRNTQVIQRFNSLEDARKFVDESGQSNEAIDLDNSGDNLLPTNVIANPPPPGSGVKKTSPDGGYFRSIASKAEKFNAFLNLATTDWKIFSIPKQRFFEYFDTLYSTNLTNKLFFPSQFSRVDADLGKHPHLIDMDKNLRPLTKGLTGQTREEIGEAIETMSWVDVATRAIQNRALTALDKVSSTSLMARIAAKSPQLAKYMKDFNPSNIKLTPTEIEHAQFMWENDIDIPRLFEFRRTVEDITKQHNKSLEFLNKQAKERLLTPEEVDARRQVIDDEYFAKYNEMADKTFVTNKDAHLEAAAIFESITRQSPDKVSLYGVTRLARALQNKEVNRAEYIAAKGWKTDGNELKALRFIEDKYENLADEFGIENRLGGYMNHYRLYGDGGYVQPSFRVQEEKQLKFVSEMIRTGELDVYERDPVLALVRYINSGFNNHRGFDQVVQSGKAYLTELINDPNLPAKAKPMLKNVAAEYVSQIKGFPDQEVQFVQDALERFLKIDGQDLKKVPVQVRSDLINTILSATTTAMVGARPAQGVRDMAGVWQLYKFRFGVNAGYWEGLMSAVKKDAEGVRQVDKLAKSGLVPHMTPLEAFTPDEVLVQRLGKTGGKVKELVQNLSEFGLKYSFQPTVYELSHAAIYLDRLKNSLTQLTEAQRKNKGLDPAYKALRLNTYSLPVRNHFVTLAEAGKINEASEYLAQVTARETVFYHGYGNSQYGGMSNFGRIGGQLGSWPMWARTYMMNMMANSSGLERAAIAGNAASSFAKLWVLSQATGINMSTWYVQDPRNLVFGGGPALQAMQDISNDEVPSVPIVPLAFKDYFDAAFSVGSRDFNPIAILLRSQGFKIDKTQKSFLDYMMGSQPDLVKR